MKYHEIHPNFNSNLNVNPVPLDPPRLCSLIWQRGVLLSRSGFQLSSSPTVVFGGACERARADGAHEEAVVMSVVARREKLGILTAWRRTKRRLTSYPTHGGRRAARGLPVELESEVRLGLGLGLGLG